MNEQTCSHCRGTKYVFVYWLEKGLEQHNVHMTDIPPKIFEKLPLEFLVYCHCNIGLLLPSNIKKGVGYCLECDGMTWRFTETAEQSGYRWKKIINLSPSELNNLPCEYFERCPCGEDEQVPKSHQRTESLRDVLNLLYIVRP